MFILLKDAVVPIPSKINAFLYPINVKSGACINNKKEKEIVPWKVKPVYVTDVFVLLEKKMLQFWQVALILENVAFVIALGKLNAVPQFKILNPWKIKLSLEV